MPGITDTPSDINAGVITIPEPIKLQQKIALRKAWFFECQLRELTMDKFMDVNALSPAPMLALVAEPVITMGFRSGQSSAKMEQRGFVYLDSGQPLRTPEEREQRHLYENTYLGRIIDWLDFIHPKRLKEKLADIKEAYEKDTFKSSLTADPLLNIYARRNVWTDENLSHALSRSTIAQARPWLIPELYNFFELQVNTVGEWLKNADGFIKNYERDLLTFASGSKQKEKEMIAGTYTNADEYKVAITSIVADQVTWDRSDKMEVSFMTKQENGDNRFDLKWSAGPPPALPRDAHKFIDNQAWHWCGMHKLNKLYLSNADSDMGLTLMMRTLYLHAPLPASFSRERILEWRKREYDPEKFRAFYFNMYATDEVKGGSRDLLEALRIVREKLKVLIEVHAANPYAPAITYSATHAEIARQVITQYKFWLDESFKFANNHGHDIDEPAGIVKARRDNAENEDEKNDAKKHLSEMEYWSENHYIMFASSEYLAGQLWSGSKFQPARDFLSPGDTSGVWTGAQRAQRGKVRVVKWLNNRLTFGWTEFNSSGYYREHLYALFNLVDFALDEDVRNKARMALDLLLFDIVRFQHKGSMGACGGRSQFKSKNNGWDNATGDLVEILLGTRGIFKDAEGELGCFVSTTSYQVPAVLLMIGSHPPDYAFIDRTRASISFDEAPRYGIQYSMKDDQKASLEKAYQSKLEKHYPFIKAGNDAITKAHQDYGAMEDDTVFWWTVSCFMNKQVVRNSIKCVAKFGLENNEPFNLLSTLIPAGTVMEVMTTVPLTMAYYVAAQKVEELITDDLSLFLEGSSRTRVNILTYKNPDVMLSTIQNFRPGQMNFQSNVCQATLSTELNVFTTSGFCGFDVGNPLFGGIGAWIGSGLVSLLTGPYAYLLMTFGVAAGVSGGVLLHEHLIHGEKLADKGDGPWWWTGYWALPMMVQHKNAVIIVYQFKSTQELLADVGSHVWFPRKGFNEVEERRTSAYEDENFFLEDILDIGPKGFWLFGRKNHVTDFLDPENNEEGYIGIFSNKRPEWLDISDEPYGPAVDKSVEEAENAAISEIAAADGKVTALEDAINSILDGLEDRDKVGYTGIQVIETTVGRIINTHASFGPKKAQEWKDAVIKELNQVTAGIIRNNMDRITAYVAAVIDHISAIENAKTVRRDVNERIKKSDPYRRLDYFQGKDWYAGGKNIWIIQVGNKTEFGSFENFMQRVSSAKVVVDDASDLECTYEIPGANGPAGESLFLDYDDRAFKLNGNDIQLDWYPRFENPFLRGGMAEWGQREYVIEYMGYTLRHSLQNMDQVERDEILTTLPNALELIKGLVIYIKTEDEDMDMDSVALATISIGCNEVATDELVAAGEVKEHTVHGPEWIFFSQTVEIMPDMTIIIRHPPIEDGDDDPAWNMSFSLKALMADSALHECRVSFPHCKFEDDRRSTIRLPFTVILNKWQPWKQVATSFQALYWAIIPKSEILDNYFGFTDIIGVDAGRQLMHRRMGTCEANIDFWLPVATKGFKGAPLLFTAPFSVTGFLNWQFNLYLFAINNNQLFYCWKYPEENLGEKEWKDAAPYYFPSTAFGMPDTSEPPIPVLLSVFSQIAVQDSSVLAGGLEVFVLSTDGNIYSHSAWLPLNGYAWRQISTIPVFTPLIGAPFQASGDYIFILDGSRQMWAGKIGHSDWNITPAWEKITLPSMFVTDFIIARKGYVFQVIINTTKGEIWSLNYNTNGPWEKVGPFTFKTFPASKLAVTIPHEDHLHLFITGEDGCIYTISWTPDTDWGDNNWRLIEADKNKQTVMNSKDKKLMAISRIKEQMELYAVGDDKALWKTWWT